MDGGIDTTMTTTIMSEDMDMVMGIAAAEGAAGEHGGVSRSSC